MCESGSIPDWVAGLLMLYTFSQGMLYMYGALNYDKPFWKAFMDALTLRGLWDRKMWDR